MLAVVESPLGMYVGSVASNLYVCMLAHFGESPPYVCWQWLNLPYVQYVGSG